MARPFDATKPAAAAKFYRAPPEMSQAMKLLKKSLNRTQGLKPQPEMNRKAPVLNSPPGCPGLGRAKK